MRRDRLLLPALLAAVWCAYLPVWRAGFIWDDNAHVTRPELRSLHGLWRIWSDLRATQQYYPLLHSAFWVEHHFFGNEALGYHLLNVALHSLNVVLLLLIVRRLFAVEPSAENTNPTDSRGPYAGVEWLAAGIFALHPVMVESVAWVAELKNTLSGAFYLGAALTYLRFDVSRSRRTYLLALGLFVLGLLSKTVVATLPAALLVVFWWRRGTLSWKRDVLPLLPFFALGAAGGLFTAWVERTLIGASGGEFAFTWVERVLIAGRACWFYVGKLFWPADLIFVYPRWTLDPGAVWQYVYPVQALLVLAILWRWRGRSRGPLAGALFFLGTLFPVLGFFNVYPFKFSFVADHFQYLASLGVIVAFSAGAVWLVRRWPAPAPVGRILGLVLLVSLGTLTWRQAASYRNQETLFSRVLEKNPDCWLAHFNLGHEAMDAGRFNEAIGHYQAILQLDPGAAGAWNDLGAAWLRMGRATDAVTASEEVVRLKPFYAPGHNQLGTALLQLGRLPEAVREFETSLRLQADDPIVHANLAIALRRLGRADEAIAHYRAALRVAPEDLDSLQGLGTALLETGHAGEALAPLESARRLSPASAEAENNLGTALLQLGRAPEAITHYEAALQLKGDDPKTHYNLGNALVQAGRLPEAIAHYTRAVQIKPAYPEALANLAGALAQSGHMDEAATRYLAALQLQPGDPELHTNLGAVLLYQGHVDAARRQFEEALRLQPNYQPARENLERLRGLPRNRP